MIPKHKNSSLGRSRDIGMPSNGKGDASRVTDQSAYAANFDEINWGPKPAPPQERFAETNGEWPDVIGIGPVSPTSDLVRE